MGIKNFLIDGVSCAGKTTVCDELQRRGYHAIHGDRELAYWGDPKTGEPITGCAGAQRTWMWNVAKVSALVADQTHAGARLTALSDPLPFGAYAFLAIALLGWAGAHLRSRPARNAAP